MLNSKYGRNRRSFDPPTPSRWRVPVCALLIVFLGNVPLYAQNAYGRYEVTVGAGGFDRQNTVVSFPLPASLDAEAYHLETPSGEPIPLQVGANRAWFILDRLRGGSERTYEMVPGRAAADGEALRRDEHTLEISVDDTPVLQYWIEPRPLPRSDLDPIYKRGGYLHPVRTPSGRVVTGDYPAGHAHHHGIWSAWTKTEFRGRTPDFWNMGEGTGAVVPMGLDSTWSGPVQAGFRARHRYVDYTGPEPVTALYEAWTLRVYRVRTDDTDQAYRLFDLVVEQSTASASPLTLAEYHYGGVAVRGPDAWYGPENSHFLTSAGRDRANGNESRARWNSFDGPVDGRHAGIAMLSHPDNFRAPQPLRLHPEMPYFTFAPPQLGAWTIEPGWPYRARYRFVTFDGSSDPNLLDRLWTDYAHPPAVTVRESAEASNR